MLALDSAKDSFGSCRVQHKLIGAKTGIPKTLRNREEDQIVCSSLVPFRKWVIPALLVGSDVRNLDADAAIIRTGRMPGSLLHIEGLVNRAIQIEHKMHTQT